MLLDRKRKLNLRESQKANRYQVYALQDPRCFTIRYIGVSECVQSRYFSHIRIANRKPKNAKEKWILELKFLNLKPILLIFDECCYEYSLDLEKIYYDIHSKQNELYQKSPSHKKYFVDFEYIKKHDLPPRVY